MVVLNRKKISLIISGIFLSIFLFIFTADNLNSEDMKEFEIIKLIDNKEVVQYEENI